ncbi:hypothetical protein [Rhizobium rhizogenes]
MPHADIADQPLKSLTPDRRCAGFALIVIDDDDNLLLAPTQGDSAPAKRVLAHGALGVVESFPHRRLADVKVGAAFTVMRLDFEVYIHGALRWWMLMAMVART